MKIVGLIAEYNPFHNGHLYHIQKAKELTGADLAVVVMSGDFVQRGAPALLPKHLRAAMALSGGADAVFELPVCYATGSAELFAEGAVSLLQQLGVVDCLCFGCECGELSALEKIAHILAEEPDSYRQHLKAFLKSGMRFPLARQKALEHYLGQETFGSLLSLPNNILGIEYLKALYRMDSSIRPHALQRVHSGYHDQELQTDSSSASAIRNTIFSSCNARTFSQQTNWNATSLESQMPSSCLAILEEQYQKQFPVHPDFFSLLIKSTLLHYSARELEQFQDLSPDLSNRIMRQLPAFLQYEQFCDRITTKELTHTRISRALIHILLDIKKEDIRSYTRQGYHEYARLLGFRTNSRGILTEIHKKSTLKLVTKSSDHFQLSSFGRHMLKKDVFAADLYESVITDRYNTPFLSDFQKQIIKF